jgi:hypothetical protein
VLTRITRSPTPPQTPAPHAFAPLLLAARSPADRSAPLPPLSLSSSLLCPPTPLSLLSRPSFLLHRSTVHSVPPPTATCDPRVHRASGVDSRSIARSTGWSQGRMLRFVGREARPVRRDSATTSEGPRQVWVPRRYAPAVPVVAQTRLDRRDHSDRKPKPLDAASEIPTEPLGHSPRHRRDADLAEVVLWHHLLDRLERIRAADRVRFSYPCPERPANRRPDCRSGAEALARMVMAGDKGVKLGSRSNPRVMPELPLDGAGRRRSPATMPGFPRRPSAANKGHRYPADLPSVEGDRRRDRTTGDGRHGCRCAG